MLIEFKEVFIKAQQLDTPITGILHVGAHYGQEIPDYMKAGVEKVVCFEPCRDAFAQLKAAYGHYPKHITLINMGCGVKRETLVMHTSADNQGQSNSLLKPALHTTQYPGIRFTGREKVEIDKLDSIAESHDFSGCNMLVMDVQGYEAHVLRGARETLKHIDYIYTEVNRDELYEGCARVGDLIAYLSDFEMVMVNWAGGTWGDALFIRKTLIDGME